MNITFDTNGNEKQKLAATYWIDKTTEQILYGGAKYGGKSYLGCSLIFGDALIYPGTHYFIARHSLTDIRKHTKPSISEVFNAWGLALPEYATYNGQDSFYELYNGSKVFLLDCKYMPSDPDYHRFGSIQMTRGWCEEIGQMDPKAIGNLFLTIGRWKNEEYGLKKKMLMTCNPHKGYGYTEFYIPNKEERLADEKKFIIALPQDNKAGDKDYILSLKNNPNEVERKRLYYGEWEYDDDPSALIDYDSIADYFSNEHVPAGDGFITADIARLGKDSTVIRIWSGFKVVYREELNKADISQSVMVIRNLATKWRIPMSKVIVDEDGVGGGVKDILRCKGFVNNSKPLPMKNSTVNYANLKSQCSFLTAAMICNKEMHEPLEDPTLKKRIIQEMEQVKRKDMDKDGKLQVIPKDTIKKNIGRSPDDWDCIMMRVWFTLNKTKIHAFG